MWENLYDVLEETYVVESFHCNWVSWISYLHYLTDVSMNAELRVNDKMFQWINNVRNRDILDKTFSTMHVQKYLRKVMRQM